MEKVQMLEELLEKLTELYGKAVEIDADDTAHAISVAEDTLMNEIKFEKAIVTNKASL